MAETLIAEGYQVATAANADTAIEILTQTPCEVVIADLRMSGMGGLELLKDVKSSYPDTQVIIVTSYACLESAVEALRAGAYDYLTKPFEDIALVSAAVNRATEKIRLWRKHTQLIEDLKNSKEDLERMNDTLLDLSIRDGLTGIHNHRYFQDFLAMEIARSPRRDNGFSLMFLDIDHFKNYNDTNGHVEGDALLFEFAKILESRFRKMDLVARYGGEEFIVLLPDMPIEESHRLAEELRTYIEEYPFRNGETQPGGKLTVSIGVASYPEDGTTSLALVTEVDRALYAAKQQGRNRVCLASEVYIIPMQAVNAN
jgi:diguanylate cyclase (GGDEF)-like protein